MVYTLDQPPSLHRWVSPKADRSGLSGCCRWSNNMSFGLCRCRFQTLLSFSPNTRLRSSKRTAEFECSSPFRLCQVTRFGRVQGETRNILLSQLTFSQKSAIRIRNEQQDASLNRALTDGGVATPNCGKFSDVDWQLVLRNGR